MKDFSELGISEGAGGLDNRNISKASPKPDSKIEIESEDNISLSAVLRELQGVTVATKADQGDLNYITRILTTEAGANRPLEDPPALTLRNWHARLKNLDFGESQYHRASLAVSIAFLCETGRRNITVYPADLDFVWSTIYEALADTSIPYTVSRSSQGFLTIALSSLIKDGNIEELFRLHVWEADGRRGTPELAIHSHQPFIQSWILAGEGKDYTYEACPEDTNASITLSEYALTWSTNTAGESGKNYKVHPMSSTVTNQNKPVHIVQKSAASHTRNMTYTVPTHVFHKSVVAPGTFHATLALFDSYRGFHRDAPVLGPSDGTSYTAKRDTATLTAPELARVVEIARERELSHINNMNSPKIRGAIAWAGRIVGWLALLVIAVMYVKGVSPFSSGGA
ncbi:uncharacterized protein F4822DRAFT_390965 [Hypoxylon trugodes]|uniref:uncharacterized protein n=1 Tax=Hypoxylon trugodes TaxID=326681 RepID=UPI00219CE668|nr:uncharacterized protein F4822DRAFT_390965 [Hypoxylon trugodes]KAI1392413.1 hypothetical protein F4822DRAFT_390965 [Hypoxylon trugodes]